MKAIETKEEQEQFITDFLKFALETDRHSYYEDIKPFIESLNNPVAGWYKYIGFMNGVNEIRPIAYRTLKDKCSGYGINSKGKWCDTEQDGDSWTFDCPNEWRPATPDEVLERLTDEAVKRYGEIITDGNMINADGQKIKYCTMSEVKIKDVAVYNRGKLMFMGMTLFNNGKWAEIIKDTCDNSSAIKVLERSKALIQEQIDKLK